MNDRVWIWYDWPRAGIVYWSLWTWHWVVGFNKKLEMSWLVEQPFASWEGLLPIKYIGLFLFGNHTVVERARKTERTQKPKKFTVQEKHKEMSTPEELAL